MKTKGVHISLVEASRIAEVLNNTLSNSGYLENWNEIVSDMKDSMSEIEILQYAKSVQFSLKFMNTFDISGSPKIVKDFYQEALEIIKYPVEKH